MLLDRRRIRKWARWVALFLAIVFGVGAIGMGVGMGVGDTNFLSSLSCSGDETTNTTAVDDRIAALLAELANNPNDLMTLQALATAYQGNGDFANAAKYLEQAIAADPSQRDIYLRLASLYGNEMFDYTNAVVVLNKAQAKFPSDPEVYLQLGLAQRTLGNTSAAILAWQKYLELAPNGDQADTIREAIATMAANATTTTTAATTTTTAATTSSTAGTTSTTGSAASSTTAAPTTTAAPGSTTTAP